jgi:hypothetical protein
LRGALLPCAIHGTWSFRRRGYTTCAGRPHRALRAKELAGTLVERNARRWTSHAHVNGQGRCVITLTHPSIAKWEAPATDPTSFVRENAGLLTGGTPGTAAGAHMAPRVHVVGIKHH